MRSRADGFALVEVLVALLVLELGMLGVAGLVALGGRTLARASLLERALYAAEQVADSLARVDEIADGERTLPGGHLRWRVTSGGPEGPSAVRITAVDAEGRRRIDLRGLLSGRPAPDPREAP